MKLIQPLIMILLQIQNTKTISLNETDEKKFNINLKEFEYNLKFNLYLAFILSL